MTPFNPQGEAFASGLGNALKAAFQGRSALRYAAISLITLCCLAVTGVLALTYAVNHGALGPMPSQAELANITTSEASRILSADGEQLGKYFLQERVDVERQNISDNVINALVATEDARFYSHEGIDYQAWARVLYRTLIKGDESSGGGSTLSQQLVKNLYGREQRAEDETVSLIINKIREIYAARTIEQLHSKDDILTLYLNTVAFPDNTYGIGVASQRYFSKEPSELNVEEAATLIGSLKATYTYDPIRNASNAYYRRNTVLDLMAKHGYIDLRTCDSLQALPITVNYFRDEHNLGIATHFRENARLELKEILTGIEHPDGRPYDLYRDGLTIETTLDAGMQRYAEQAVKEHLIELQAQFDQSLDGETAWEVEGIYDLAYRNSNRVYQLRKAGFGESYIDSIMSIPLEMRIYDPETTGAKTVMISPADSIAYYLGILNSGFMVTEPTTGAILAWVGGSNHEFFKYDKVQSHRSVGSTFKPIVYATALQQGVDPQKYWGNYRRTYWKYEGWRPRNSGDEYGGWYNMRGGLTNSINTISVQLMMNTGPKNVVKLAHDMGITSNIPAVPAIALGAGEVSLEEMLQAYSVFANRGEKQPLHYIKQIRNREGKVIYDAFQQGELAQAPTRVLAEEDADLIRGMLESVVDEGTGRRLRWKYKFEGAIAGKTGTSQNHSDGWFIGFTPRLLAGAWTGAESPAVRFRTIKYGQGAHMALPIWGRFMSSLREDEKYAYYLGGSFPEASEHVAEVLAAPMRYYAPHKEPAAQKPDEAVADTAPDAAAKDAKARAATGSGVDEQVVDASPATMVGPMEPPTDRLVELQ